MDEYNEAILVSSVDSLFVHFTNSLAVSLATLLVEALLHEVEMEERLLA